MKQQSSSFIPNWSKSKQDDIIYNKFNVPYPTSDEKPINEICKDRYISRAFLVLFPDDIADFSDCHNDDSMSFVEYCEFLMQYKDGRFAQY